MSKHIQHVQHIQQPDFPLVSAEGPVQNRPLPDTDKLRIIAEIPGPEDILIDHDRGIAYISSQLRVPGSASQVNGAIFCLDLKRKESHPVNVSGNWEELFGLFHPHGFDLFIGEDGFRRLFVINHRSSENHCIEIFDVDDKNQFSYRGRVEGDDALTSPNDLVALDKDRFLVVNDHGFRSRLAKSAEDLLRLSFHLGMGTVVEGQLTPDGPQWKTLCTGIGLGAGIEVDDRRNPKQLYVTSASANQIWIYQQEHASWTKSRSIDLPAGPDNLSWDQQGRLWVAAHPDPLAYVLYMAGWREAAPSRIFCIQDPANRTPTVHEVFVDSGRRLSASSVAVLYTKSNSPQLLIGAVSGRHLLIYDLPAQAANSDYQWRQS